MHTRHGDPCLGDERLAEIEAGIVASDERTARNNAMTRYSRVNDCLAMTVESLENRSLRHRATCTVVYETFRAVQRASEEAHVTPTTRAAITCGSGLIALR